jgi:hypothetical protein
VQDVFLDVLVWRAIRMAVVRSEERNGCSVEIVNKLVEFRLLRRAPSEGLLAVYLCLPSV